MYRPPWCGHRLRSRLRLADNHHEWHSGDGGLAVIVVLVGAVLFIASETPQLRVIFGIATLAGLAGVTVFSRAKRFVSRIAFRVLTRVHDHS